MQILNLIALGTFFVLSVLFSIFYAKMRNKRDKIASELKKSEDSLALLTKKYEIAVKELRPPKRGYYKNSTNLIIDKEKKIYELYEYVVHLTEIERFTNGDCRVKLDYIDVIAGFDPGQYDWIKKSATMRFPSIMKISDIEWLESEEDIKKLRREKIERIENVE